MSFDVPFFFVLNIYNLLLNNDKIRLDDYVLERIYDMNTVMIVAAGSGKRMNAGMNKQFIKINDKEIVAHTIERFYNSPLIDEIVLCIKEEEEDFVRENIIEKYGFKDIVISYGGKERQDTINNGLEKVSPNCDILLIHDGARPLLQMRL